MKKAITWILHQALFCMMAIDIVGTGYNLWTKPVGWKTNILDFIISFAIISVAFYVNRKKPDTQEKK